MRPAIMALVVAMAGMMLPAIALTSNLLVCGMPKQWARRLEHDVTKSRHSLLSLSQTRWSPCANACTCAFSRVRESLNTSPHSCMLHSR
uniref:Putative secreted protein n=1 Tax=Ixodes ricinus TaxID=34613 RepID=A0A6B0UB76_IXORI